MALSKTTQNHEEIKAWAEKRGGRPADVESTETAGEAGIIRLESPDAPNANDANLKEIDWEPFFEKFDKSGLAMVYQEVTKEGAESNFYKFVHPENVSGSSKKSAGTSVSKKATAKKAASSKKSVTSKKAAPVKKSVPAKKATPAKAAAKAPAKKASAKTAVKEVAARKSAAKSATVKKGSSKKAVAKKASATQAKKTVTKKR